MKNIKILWVVVGVSVIGIGYIIYKRIRKPKNTNESNEKSDTIFESIFDTNDTDYKNIKDRIESAKKNVLNFYEKNGNVLRDKETGNSISFDATKSAYWMITREIVRDSNIVYSSYASNRKKNAIRELVDSYLNDYLPRYFDKSTFNINANWYKEILAKSAKYNK